MLFGGGVFKLICVWQRPPGGRVLAE
jgi:hypothetical protein